MPLFRRTAIFLSLMLLTVAVGIPAFARPLLDEGDFGVDLRDLQDVSPDPGQVFADPRGLYRQCHYFVFWIPAAPRTLQGRHDSDLQPVGNRGQLLRCLVWDSRQHVREFSNGLCEPSG